jgi:hypothetical protein
LPVFNPVSFEIPKRPVVKNKIQLSLLLLAYAIFDMNGKMLQKGKLSNGMNTISAGSIINGMYLIRFSDGNDEWAEKLVKQ